MISMMMIPGSFCPEVAVDRSLTMSVINLRRLLPYKTNPSLLGPCWLLSP